MMSTRFLATVSAVLLGAAGVALLFAADDLLASLAGTNDRIVVAMAQLLGGAWMGLAWATWLTRGTPQGGIYGRPIVLANATLYFVSALVCARGAAGSTSMLAVAIVAGVMAAAYGLVMFGTSPGAPR